MKNLSLLFIALLFIQLTTLAQEGWFLQTSGTTEDLRGVSFTDSDNGTVVGAGGTILRTTDGGITWQSQTSGTTEWLNEVIFTDSDIGTVVGASETILRTTDGGTNWTSQTSGTTGILFGVSFTDSYNGTAVCDNGTILRTTNGGVSFVEEEEIDVIPTEFLLSQNYPNPFNSSSVIRYSVPQSSDVVIKVFDILGNEIETLVNEEKTVGTYEITWTADNLPSGIYLYQLRAGSYVQTRKMVLMR